MDAVKKIKESSTWTAPGAKRAGNTDKYPVEWDTQKGTVMEIILAKAEQVSKFRDKLDSSNSNKLFAEATFDVYWGIGKLAMYQSVKMAIGEQTGIYS